MCVCVCIYVCTYSAWMYMCIYVCINININIIFINLNVARTNARKVIIGSCFPQSVYLCLFQNPSQFCEDMLYYYLKWKQVASLIIVKNSQHETNGNLVNTQMKYIHPPMWCWELSTFDISVCGWVRTYIQIICTFHISIYDSNWKNNVLTNMIWECWKLQRSNEICLI